MFRDETGSTHSKAILDDSWITVDTTSLHQHKLYYCTNYIITIALNSHKVKVNSTSCAIQWLDSLHMSNVICNRTFLFFSKEKIPSNINWHMLKGFLTSAEVFFFSRENFTIASGEVNTILFIPSAHSTADARRNTFFSALNIPFESQQKQNFQITKSSFARKTKIQLNSGFFQP